MEYLIAIGVAVMIYILMPKKDSDEWDGSDLDGGKYIKKIVPVKKAVKKRTRKSTARDKTQKKKVTTKKKTKRKTKNK